MKAKKRQKLCYNCEGEVDLDVIVCPYCAADLRVEKPEIQRAAYDPSLSLKNLDTQNSLYPPTKSSFSSNESSEEIKSFSKDSAPLNEQIESEKGMIGPTILLTLGVQFLLFGLLLCIFSQNGVVILKWDARFWFFYLLSAIPLLIFGYRGISKL